MKSEQTQIDKLCEQYVNDLAKDNPIDATSAGIKGYDHLWPDYSPEGLAKTNEIHDQMLKKAQSTPIENHTDKVTLKALSERINLYKKLYETGQYHSNLNNIESPIQNIRDIFDLQAQSTNEDFQNIITRLETIQNPLQGYIQSLTLAKNENHISAVRQIKAVCNQLEELTSDNSPLHTLEKVYNTIPENNETLSSRLKEAIRNAKKAFKNAHNFTIEQLLPFAPHDDAFGRQRYELFSQYFVGAKIDLDETYDWGLEELNKIDLQQKEIIKQLYGENITLLEAIHNLNNDPKYILNGTCALQHWMQHTANDAIDKLKNTHFEIDSRIQNIKCAISPSQSGGIYYTGPSQDFKRPGTMWWSVPNGTDNFVTWQEKTTVYHEGVPGHHLQVGQTMCLKNLNTWRKSHCWISGHGEGWALYAEQLMDELGFLQDMGEKMGMLDAQRLRASRVVLDIGVHLKKQAPSQYDNKTWNAEIAWKFLKDNVAMDESFLRFEWERYLGWAGQAPSYKIGQRLWLETRNEYLKNSKEKNKQTALKKFHKKALDLGSLSLDILKEELSN